MTKVSRVHRGVAVLMLRCLSGPLILLVVVTLARLQVISVSGMSMEDTLHHGDRLVIVRTGGLGGRVLFSRSTIRRGDVVALRDPLIAGRLLVKRVVGVPGDRVSIREGCLLVNGIAQSELQTVKRGDSSWPTRGSRTPAAPVPRDHYFVLADNRMAGMDSRFYGSIRQEAVVGVVLGVIRRAHRPIGASSDSLASVPEQPGCRPRRARGAALSTHYPFIGSDKRQTVHGTGHA